MNFKIKPMLRFGFTLALVATPVMCWQFRHNEGAHWLHGTCLFAYVAVFLAWPRAISFADEGIRQRTLFGRIKKMAWDEVEVVPAWEADGDGSGHFNIVVKSGKVKIVQNGLLHSDQALFCKLIEQRTGKQIYGVPKATDWRDQLHDRSL